MDKNISTYKAKSFINETNMSSMVYEVKRTRAVFDDSLSIPGTNRRGGWRCPPGTRYGGQITDRFGRNCGWGVSRRLANEVSDLGERLENVGDRRRGRRAARAERAVERARKPGLVERAAGNIARVLDTNETVDTPKPTRTRRGAGRPNLRLSEQRRMDREIDQPGAPRTGDMEVQPARRPRPNAPAARRRPAAQQVAREKPKPEVIDVPEVPQPAKKAVVKKAAAKKKAVKKKAPAKKAAARRITPQAINREESILTTNPPAAPSSEPLQVPSALERVRQIIADGKEIEVAGVSFGPEALKRIAGLTDEEALRYIDIADRAVADYKEFIKRFSAREVEFYLNQMNGDLPGFQNLLEERIKKLRDDSPTATPDEIVLLQHKVNLSNAALIEAKGKKESLRQRLEELRQEAANPRMATQRPVTARPLTPEVPPMDPLRPIFAGRQLGFDRNWQNERQRILDLPNDFAAMDETALIRKVSDFQQNIDWNAEYLNNLQGIDANQRIQLPNRVVKAGDLKEEVQGVVNAWQSLKDGANARLAEINANRLPGLHGVRALRGQNLEGFNTIEIARTNMDRLVSDYAGARFNILNHNGKFFVVSQDQLNRAQLNGLDNPRVLERKGGLPLANELPPIDSDIARQAKDRVDKAIQKRQDVLALYLNDRYGEGNAPWKEMTAERRIDLGRRAARGDADAKQELIAWAKAMYEHPEIQGTNNETYRNKATVSYGPNALSVNLEIQRKNADGTWTKVGFGTRTIYHTEVPAHVYNNRLEVSEQRSKNSGIQTIINQHAFMYGQAAGFEYFGVSAIDDGPYVWGRIGFTQKIAPDGVAKMNNELSKFRDGGNSIIKNETDARIIEHVIGEWIRDPEKVRHLDFISALSIEGNGQAKKDRDTELRNWFVSNMAFSSGKLNLNDNNISPDPRERVRA